MSSKVEGAVPPAPREFSAESTFSGFMIITISNLFPRPDQPTRGMFNYQMFRGIAASLASGAGGGSGAPPSYVNICLVSEWRWWKWAEIGGWRPPSPLQPCGVTIYLPVAYLPLLGRGLNWWFSYRALRSLITSHPLFVDGGGVKTEKVFLASWLYPDAVAVARLAREFGHPVWLRVHGSDRYHLRHYLRRRMIIRSAGEAQGVICNSNAVAADLIRWGIPSNKIHVVLNGVDTSLFRVRNDEETFGPRPQAADQEQEQSREQNAYVQNPEFSRSDVSGMVPGVSSSSPLILFVANLVPVKGPDIMLKAFARLGQTTDYGLRTTKQCGDLTTKVAKDTKGGGENGDMDGQDIQDGERRDLTTTVSLEGKGARDENQANLLRQLYSSITKGFANFASTVLRGREIRKTLSSPCLCASVVQTASLPLPRLLIIGAGPMRARLERQAWKLGVADRVHFLGNRSHKEVAQWMKVADVFCLTSRSEGMPNVVLEARASGLPVVATPAGAIPDLPLDKMFVAKTCSASAVAEALSLALASDLSDKTPSAVIPSWEKQAGKILELIGRKCQAFITVTNLFPWPKAPTRGLYNYRLFGEMDRLLCGQGPGGIRQNRATARSFRNICLVPEWRFWRWPEIRNWNTPDIQHHAACDNHSSTAPYQSTYLPVFYLPLFGRSLNPFLYRWSLRQWALTVSPGDVLYVPWLYPDGVAVSRSVLGKRTRLWLMTLGSDTFHLQSPSRRKKILKACIDAQGVVCVARVLCDRLAAAGVPHAKLHVVPNGVDTSLFRMRDKTELAIRSVSPSLPDRPLGKRNASSKTVLFVGNLVPVKGPDLLLRAFAALCEAIESRGGIQNPEFRIQNGELGRAESSPDVALVIIGMGVMHKKLERMARDLGIAEKVEFLGAQAPCDVATWMNRADVLCLTSRNEGMPNVVLEALASGLPVVATDVGACKEMLAGEPAARICRSEDVEGIAQAMGELLAMDVDRKAMAERHAGQNSWRKMAETIVGMMGSA